MPHELNPLGQPVGPVVADWSPPPFPSREAIAGRFCRLEPLDASRHAADLYAANCLDDEGRNWTYLPYGPFESFASFRTWVAAASDESDTLFSAVIDASTGSAVGVAAYLRIDPGAGSIEVGHLNYSPLLQRRPTATEAMYLLMRHAFELGYRRYEWKCDALNLPSRAAAERLGFTYEGLFRQARVNKGRNRDTAWYAIIDRDWPRLRGAFEQWLAPSNFDERGVQRVSLSSLTAVPGTP
jgi:RimJ/RimL family protein N-acetyltransferase